MKPDAEAFERSLRAAGDLLVTFMGEQDTYRINHKNTRPLIAGSKDALWGRASRGNKLLVQAMQMAVKALILAQQQYGDADPNAPRNRPVHRDPVAEQPAPRVTTRAGATAATTATATVAVTTGGITEATTAATAVIAAATATPTAIAPTALRKAPTARLPLPALAEAARRAATCAASVRLTMVGCPWK